MTSVDSEEELNLFIRESDTVMRSGGFELCGWEIFKDLLGNKTTRVLGVLWNKRKDVITINPTVLEIDFSTSITKRNKLPISYKSFEPIGITCPVSLQPKPILQSLCEEGVNWDIKT